MQRYQGEHERLEILYQVVKYSQSFRILGFVDIHQGADFSSLVTLVLVYPKQIDMTNFERDVLIAETYLKLLLTVLVLLWPLGVVFPGSR